MTPPSIETSTREERQTYVRKKWECHHQRDGSFDGIGAFYFSEEQTLERASSDYAIKTSTSAIGIGPVEIEETKVSTATK